MRRESRLGANVWALMSVTLILCACRRQQGPPPMPPLVVTVAKPIAREVVDASYFTGRTEGSEFVDVRARVSGYLTKIHFQPGTMVNKDQLLFEIDDRPYVAALHQATAELARAKAHVQRVKADAERTQRLFASKSVSKEELDRSVGDQGEAVAEVDTALSKVERAQLDLTWTKVKAPIEGIVSRDFINAGNLVTADQTKLTTIVKQDPMFVYYDIDERTVLRILKLIREGKFKSARENRVPIQMALANDQGYPHVGYVSFVDNRLDPNTGTMRIRGTFDNPRTENGGAAIAAGLFARVRLEVAAAHPALLVTERAIVSDQGQKLVYVVNDKGEVERRDVTLGPLEGGLRAVESGLAAGERVVINGIQRVRPGVRVDAQETPMPDPRGASEAAIKPLLRVVQPNSADPESKSKPASTSATAPTNKASH